MKPLFFLLSASLLILVGCGKKDDTVATTNAVAAPATTCTQPGYIYTAQYGCAPAQQGYPNGGVPPQQFVYPNQQHTGCSGFTPPNPWGNPYGYRPYCNNFQRTRWYFRGGVYFFYFI